MPASHRTDHRSPFTGGRPTIYLVGSEDDPDISHPAPPHPSAPRSLEGQMAQVEIAEVVADIVPANSSMPSTMTPPPMMVSVPTTVDLLPTPIRWVAQFIAAIRWLPIAWKLLRSIPSEARQAWKSAFGDKKE